MASCGILCQYHVAFAASLAAVAGGATLAYLAGRMPARAQRMETIAGILLVVGLALLGANLQLSLS